LSYLLALRNRIGVGYIIEVGQSKPGLTSAERHRYSTSEVL
jgi:hypothetical protein